MSCRSSSASSGNGDGLTACNEPVEEAMEADPAHEARYQQLADAPWSPNAKATM